MARGFWGRGGDGGGLQICEGEQWGVKMWALPPLWDSALLSGACDEKKMETLGMMCRVSGGGAEGRGEEVASIFAGQPLTPFDNGAHLLAHPPLPTLLSDANLPICKLEASCAFVRISPSIPTHGLRYGDRLLDVKCFTTPGWIDEAHSNLNDAGSHAKPGAGAAQTCGGIVTRKENREDSP